MSEKLTLPEAQLGAPKLVVDLGRVGVSSDIVIDFSDDVATTELLQQHGLAEGLPPNAAEQVPDRPHVFDAQATVQQGDRQVNLGRTKVLAAHGYQKFDPQTQKSVWSFADGRSIAETVTAYNTDAASKGLQRIELLAVCNNDPTAVQEDGMALAVFNDVTHAVGSDVRYALRQEANGVAVMNVDVVSKRGHFFIAAQN